MRRELPPASPLGRLARGFRYPISAVRFVQTHKLWVPVLSVIFIQVLLFSAVVYVGGSSIPTLVNWITSHKPTDNTAVVWLFKLLIWLAWIVAIFGIVVLAMVIVLLLGKAIASPLLDYLSERVESIVLQTPAAPWSLTNLFKSLRISFADLCAGIALVVVLQFVFWLSTILIPVLGSVVSSVGAFVATALLLAHEFVGWPLTRRFASYTQRWRFIWNQIPSNLGFGMAAGLVVIVPGLNLMMLPFLSVGGTLLFCDLHGDKQHSNDFSS